MNNNSALSLELNDIQYRTLIEKSTDVFALINKSRRVTYISPSVQHSLGYTPEEIIRMRNPLRLIHPSESMKILKLYTQAVREPEKEIRAVFHVRHKDRTYKWIESVATNYLHDEAIKSMVINFRDITERKQYEEQLAASEAKFKKMFYSNIIGVFIADIGGTFLEANNTFLSLLGYSKKDLLDGKFNRNSLTPEEYENQTNQAIVTLFETGSATTFEKEYKRKDGTRVPVLVAYSRIGSTDTYVGYVVDITEQKELEKRKDNFIIMASHELKTPLTSAKVYAELIKKEFKQKREKKAVKYLSRMDQQIARLTRLVHDLLDISHMQTGKLNYHMQTFKLQDLIEDTVDIIRSTSKNHKIVITGNIEEKIIGDRERIRQALLNLLLNAVKYSPHDSEVKVKVEKNRENICIYIQDHGKGIPKDQIPKIFERFYRVTDSNSYTYPGMGVGLFITKEIIKRHNGKISVKSEPDKGSTFIISLPIAK